MKNGEGPTLLRQITPTKKRHRKKAKKNRLVWNDAIEHSKNRLCL